MVFEYSFWHCGPNTDFLMCSGVSCMTCGLYDPQNSTVLFIDSVGGGELSLIRHQNLITKIRTFFTTERLFSMVLD